MSVEVVKVDTKAIAQLGADIERGKRKLLGRLGERGYQLLRDEVPVATGNLKQGVTPADVDYDAMEATLTVSARSGRASLVAEVFNAQGQKVKTVALRPQQPYNYAEVVARGNKDAVLSPGHAQAFLIPVPTAPTGEGYLMAGGQVYIVRRTRKGQRPNPFDERAARRLEQEAPKIGDAVLREFV